MVTYRKRPADTPLLPLRATKQMRLGDIHDAENQTKGLAEYVYDKILSFLGGTNQTTRPQPKSPQQHSLRRRSSYGGTGFVNKRKGPPPRPASVQDLTQLTPSENGRSVAPLEVGPDLSQCLRRQSSIAEMTAQTRPLGSSSSSDLPSGSRPAIPRPQRKKVNNSRPPAHEIIDLAGEDTPPVENDARPRISSHPTINANGSFNLDRYDWGGKHVPSAARKATATSSKCNLDPTSEQHSYRFGTRNIALAARSWPNIEDLTAQKTLSNASSSSSGDRKSSYSSSKTSSSITDLASNSSFGSLGINNLGLQTPNTSVTSTPRLKGINLPRFPLSGSNLGTRVKMHQDGRKIRAVSPKHKRGGHRKLKEKPHIFDQQFKAGQAARLGELRQGLKGQLFGKHKTVEFKGTKEDFEGWFDYVSDVRKAIPDEAKKGNDAEWAQIWWKRKVEALASLAPPPPLFTPSLDQINATLRCKDQAIDESRTPKFPKCLPLQDEATVLKFLKTPGVVSKCAREQVTAQDLSRLNPAQWLNDEIINFYGAMLNQRAENPKTKVKRGTVLNAYYFSSFFWAKLTNDGYEKGKLNRWTKKVDIFSKDVILIPVNHNNTHWTAAAINFRQKRIESYDSLGMAGKNVCNILREYIAAEHLNKKKKNFDFDGWTDFVPNDNPQQENGYDCGVFTCQTLESLSRGEESLIFTQQNMPYLRRRMIWEIGTATIREM